MEELLRKKDVINYLKNRRKHYEKCATIAMKRNQNEVNLRNEDIAIIDEILNYFSSAKGIRFPANINSNRGNENKKENTVNEQVPRRD